MGRAESGRRPEIWQWGFWQSVRSSAAHAPPLGSNPARHLRRNARPRRSCAWFAGPCCVDRWRPADARWSRHGTFGDYPEARHLLGAEPPRQGPCRREDPEGFNLRQSVCKSVPWRPNGSVARARFSSAPLPRSALVSGAPTGRRARPGEVAASDASVRDCGIRPDQSAWSQVAGPPRTSGRREVMSAAMSARRRGPYAARAADAEPRSTRRSGGGPTQSPRGAVQLGTAVGRSQPEHARRIGARGQTTRRGFRGPRLPPATVSLDAPTPESGLHAAF